MELDPALHARRAHAHLKAEQLQQQQQQQQLQQQQQHYTDAIDASDGDVAETQAGIRRVAGALSLLGQGIATGGFRWVVPQWLDRSWRRWTQPSQQSPSSGDHHSLWQSTLLPGLALPAWFADWEPSDWDVASSALAGGLSGYCMARLAAADHARRFKLTTVGHLHSAGVRGAGTWSLLAGIGQCVWDRVEGWRQDQIIHRRIRSLYHQAESQSPADAQLPLTHHQAMTVAPPVPAINAQWNSDRLSWMDESALLAEEKHSAAALREAMRQQLEAYVEHPVDLSAVPAKEAVLGWSWLEAARHPAQFLGYLSETYFDWTLLLPNVHTQEQYEYRQYLEAKVRLLHDEVELLEREKRRLWHVTPTAATE